MCWPRRDLNTQPSDLESDALPLRHEVTALLCRFVCVCVCAHISVPKETPGRCAPLALQQSNAKVVPHLEQSSILPKVTNCLSRKCVWSRQMITIFGSADDPDVIWTRNLLIWSQTRYRCATRPLCWDIIHPPEHDIIHILERWWLTVGVYACAHLRSHTLNPPCLDSTHCEYKQCGGLCVCVCAHISVPKHTSGRCAPLVQLVNAWYSSRAMPRLWVWGSPRAVLSFAKNH